MWFNIQNPVKKKKKKKKVVAFSNKIRVGPETWLSPINT